MFNKKIVISLLATAMLLPFVKIDIAKANTIDIDNYELVASDEFDDSDLNEDLWFKWYMPHWTDRKKCEAKYEMKDGNIELIVTPDMVPWDPKYDNETVISGIQTGEKNELHSWSAGYKGIKHSEDTVLNHIQKYGYYEIRAKIAKGGGLHSAWWMIGFQQDSPTWKKSIQNAEVDIFEALGRNGTKNLKFNLIKWGDKSLRSSNILHENTLDFDMSEDFHVYGFEWDETSMNLYVDGELFRTYDQSVAYPMITLLGLYEKRHKGAWTRPFDDTVPYPKKFIVDYWRAYQKKDMLHRQNEAEYATVLGKARTDRKLGASGKKVVGYIGKGYENRLEFNNLYVSEAGEYDVDIHYLSKENRDLSILVNGSDNIELVDLNSGSWNKVAVETVKVYLDKGDNSIVLYNDSAYAPDIDKIVVRSSENIASKAEVKVSNSTLLLNRKADKINDSDMTTTYQSSNSYELPEYIEFNWKEPVSVSKVKLFNTYGEMQGITDFDIEVLRDLQGDWEKVASSEYIDWDYDVAVLENREVEFDTRDDVIALRLKVKEANSEWNHYAVNEVEIY